MHLYMILWAVFHLPAVVSTLTQDTGVVSAVVGDNVTLRCFYESETAMHFSWYRQTLGARPRRLFTVYKFSESPIRSERDPRFSVDRREGVNHLYVSDVHLSDSDYYFCGSSHSNIIEFGEGVFLSVKEANLDRVVQAPSSESVQPGDSVTFSCTVHPGACEGEHRLYWFRHGPRQGILHTREVQALSGGCVYNFQTENLSSSDAGTYYCVVASCGEILFGSGSELVIRDQVRDPAAQIRILVGLSVIRAGILLLVVTGCLLVYCSKLRKECPSL